MNDRALTWHKMARFRRVILTITLLCASYSAGADSHQVNDIKPFGLLDVGGYIRVGYLFDDRERGTDGEGVFERRSTWEEEVLVLTKSFIYHPGFLNMELGGGPLLVQQSFDSDTEVSNNSDTYGNIIARLNFLDLKAYPISMFFERSHPSATTSLAGRFLTQNDVYGFDGRIGELFAGSTSLNYSVSRRDAQGSGFGSVVDDVVDTTLIRMQTSYRDSDRLTLQYDTLEQASQSGSAGLPIVPSFLDQENAEIRAENYFGADKQVELRQYLRRRQQEQVTTQEFKFDDLRYSGRLRWNLSDDTNSFLRYETLDSQRSDADVETSDAEFSVVHGFTDGLILESAIGQSTTDQTGFERDMRLLRAAVNYSRETKFGGLGMSGSLRAARTDQVSSADEIAVIDEPITLVGTNQVALANEFVVVESVQVSNAQGTQIYVEGLDYRLVTVGSITRIQRLVPSTITDGETVLVDYRYETSGTAEFDTLASALSVNVSFLNTLTAFVRYDWQDTDVRSGSLTNPVNDRDRVELGITMSNQFLDGWSIDGQYRHVVNDEEISPYVSDLLDAGFSSSLFGRFKVAVSAGISEIDYENSPEDVQQVTYRLRLGGRAFNRSRFSYEVSYLDDAGGSEPRRQVRHRLSFQWSYRQVQFDLRGYYFQDRLGVTERDETRITGQLTRVF